MQSVRAGQLGTAPRGGRHHRGAPWRVHVYRRRGGGRGPNSLFALSFPRCPNRLTSLRGFVRFRPTYCSTFPQLWVARRRHRAVLTGHGPGQQRKLDVGYRLSKLLLASVPPGLGAADEVSKRSHAQGGAPLRGSAPTSRSIS